jgi:PAS domain S-box-containing protein
MEKLDRKDKTIFVVDDNSDNLGIVAGFLKSAGYEVSVASSGNMAVNRAERIKPVVILLDINMPGMDGFEVCRKLKRNTKTLNIPVIFLTASDDIKSIKKGFQVGGVDYLVKPVQKDELLVRVLTQMENYIYKNKLEQEVRNRTRDLEESNKLLKEEIARRVETEKQLWQSQERLDLAMFAANYGLWDWYLDSNAVVFDSRYYTMAGYEHNEFPAVYEEWEKRVHPDDVQQVKSAIERYLTGDHQTYDVEFRFLRRDGDYMWIRGKGKVVSYDENGKPVRFIGTHSDITPYKRVEIALQTSEANYRTIFDSGYDAIIVHDMETGEILDANKRMSEMFGYTHDEALNLTVEEISLGEPPYTQNEAAKWINKAVTQGPQTFEWICKNKNGKTFWVEVALKRVTIAGQERVLATDRDISERKQAEEEVWRLRNYLSNIINSMPSMIIGVDVDARITLWNKTAENSTGIIVDRALGKILSDVFPGMTSEMTKIIESIRTRKVEQKQNKPRLSENEICYEDVTIYPLIANGVEGAVIRIDDVTNKVRMEEMMIQSDKMVSLGGLAAGMAHEINNPLGIIMARVQSVDRRFSPKLEKNSVVADKLGIDLDRVNLYMQERNIDDYLVEIREAGSRAAKIVRNMLDFSRKSESIRTEVSVQKMLDKALDLASHDYDLKKKFDFRSILITREYDESLPLLNVAETEIEQVIMNLLKNAAQAMTEKFFGDEIPRIILRTSREDRWIRIEIVDNGPGMDTAIRKRVFEPFFTTKEVGAGTGLGLSVSYFIITNNHGGEFWVESRQDKGTNFIIRLPVENFM